MITVGLLFYFFLEEATVYLGQWKLGAWHQWDSAFFSFLFKKRDLVGSDANMVWFLGFAHYANQCSKIWFKFSNIWTLFLNMNLAMCVFGGNFEWWVRVFFYEFFFLSDYTYIFFTHGTLVMLLIVSFHMFF